MLIEEEIKEVNPDAIEEGFEDLDAEDEIVVGVVEEDEEFGIDLAFVDDEKHW